MDYLRNDASDSNDSNGQFTFEFYMEEQLYVMWNNVDILRDGVHVGTLENATNHFWWDFEEYINWNEQIG